MKNNKLIILDVDHTLLHTWHHNEAGNAIAIAKGYEPLYEEGFDADVYKETLLSVFPGSFEWEEGVVCPRPYLQDFLSFLQSTNTDIAIYSTGMKIYLDEVLGIVCPDLLKSCVFVWSRSDVIKQKNRKIKDINLVAEKFGYKESNILMIDDLYIVQPFKNHLPISRFDVSKDSFDEAKSDKQLLNMKEKLKPLLETKEND